MVASIYHVKSKTHITTIFIKTSLDSYNIYDFSVNCFLSFEMIVPYLTEVRKFGREKMWRGASFLKDLFGKLGDKHRIYMQ